MTSQDSWNQKKYIEVMKYSWSVVSQSQIYAQSILKSLIYQQSLGLEIVAHVAANNFK